MSLHREVYEGTFESRSGFDYTGWRVWVCLRPVRVVHMHEFTVMCAQKGTVNTCSLVHNL